MKAKELKEGQEFTYKGKTIVNFGSDNGGNIDIEVNFMELDTISEDTCLKEYITKKFNLSIESEEPKKVSQREKMKWYMNNVSFQTR